MDGYGSPAHAISHMRMRIILAHNLSAGTGAQSPDVLRRLIEQYGHTLESFSSKDDAWKEAVARGADLVVAAGGDGTVRKVAIGVGNRLPIAVLPLGTANNVSTALGLGSMSIEALVASWDTARHRSFDLGVARGPWGVRQFVESVGVGLLAEGMAAIDSGDARHVNEIGGVTERLAEARRVFQQVLEQLQPQPIEITIDGTSYAGDYLLVEALNFGAAGPRLALSPSADGSDGQLDIVLVEASSREALVQTLAGPSDGAAAPRLRVHRGRQMTMRLSPTRCHIDDTIKPARLEASQWAIDLSIEPDALTFLVQGDT
jgi:diacylglycerol kinase (ATP)